MSEIARRHLDERLGVLQHLAGWQRPAVGWIRALRDSLGMTTQQLGKRLGVSQVRVVALEKDEAKGSLKLSTLQKAAEGLDCTLVYALVPKHSLQAFIEKQAFNKAKVLLAETQHTMGLENQAPQKQDEEMLLKNIVQQLLQGSESRLWD